ncbi:LysR family transcriptional regulator [Microlunatus flavus]|uniref:DNA-binding transcriptional regulator, LysR family n=1 Tax=Microlunatus flavus TaxID=1036181 RepID=A0A1H9HDE2_9ACTN|nr:LysR family transcriptional regulator [Microlunatus flavus]SEQ60373.1 DNA-binding transcriptional regulator, LysR family [Microlunatus flavus]
MRWTLDQLRTLVAVADEGTMSGAAASLGYTTGAVSQQMAALGRAVGRTLFVRDGVRLVLSDDGRVLLEQARLVLEAERRASAVVRGPSPAAAVRLGVFGSAAVVGLPAAQVLLADDPTVALQAVEVDVEAMPDAVLRDEIDLALGLDYSDAPLPPRRGLDVARLHRERFLLVLPPGGGADLTSAEEVRAYADATDWILPPATSTFGRAVRAACARAGIAPRERHLVTDTAVSIALAEAGLGITLVTPLMLAMRATTAPTVPLPGPSTRDVVALVRTSALQRAGVVRVRSALVEAFGREKGSPGL